MVDHGWRECRPVYVAIGTPPPGRRERMIEAADRVWSYLPDADRRAFHRFTCYNSRTATDLRAAANITRQIRAEAGLVSPFDLIREFGVAVAVNDDPALLREIFAMEPGVPLTPQGRDELLASGDARHTVWVVRVRDLREHEDSRDPRFAAVRARRQIAPCADCEQDCYFDPHGQVAPEAATMICTACARWRLVTERRGATS